MNIIVFLWTPDLLTNFSFSRKRLNTFPWWYATDMMPFLFVRRISSYCFIMFAASSGFSTFSASSFKSSISMTLLWTQMLFDFIFVKRLCLLAVFRVSPLLKRKNNRYTKNIKHSLQTKMQLRWTQNTSFSRWLRVVKVLRHRQFRKTVFQIYLISKKILKSFC